MTLVGVAAKNILRNKFRTALTIIGFAVAIITFMLLRTVLYAWSSGADYAQKDRIVTRNKVTFVMTIPKRYVDVLREVDGVKATGFANWFGGKDPAHDKEFFGTLAVSDDYFDVVSEMSIDAAAAERFKTDRRAAIVGDALANKLGYKVGDTITLESPIYPSTPDDPWTFQIAGIYTATAKSVDRSSLVFRWDYLNDKLPPGRKDEIGWIFSRVKPGVSPADLSVAIDKRFEIEEIQTLTQDERSFNASFLAGISVILTALNVVSLVILIIVLLILGNTIAMGVRERTQEYGVLRAIGFLPKHVVIFIVGESMVTALIGGGIGLALAYPFIEQGLGRWLEENMGNFFPYFRVRPLDAGLAVLASVVLGLLAAALPAFSASRLRVTDALRRVA